MTGRSHTAFATTGSMQAARPRISKPIGALLAISAALLLVFTTATTAQAHVVYQSDEVWSNSDSSKCLYIRSEVSHGSGAGFAKSHALASSGIPLTQACIAIWNRNPGDLRTAWRYLYWNGYEWGVCRQLMGELVNGYWQGYGNTTKTSKMELKYDFGEPGLAPCGGGYYGTQGYGAVNYGGEWLGTNVSMWSGQHYFEP